MACGTAPFPNMPARSSLLPSRSGVSLLLVPYRRDARPMPPRAVVEQTRSARLGQQGGASSDHHHQRKVCAALQLTVNTVHTFLHGNSQFGGYINLGVPSDGVNACNSAVPTIFHGDHMPTQ